MTKQATHLSSKRLFALLLTALLLTLPLAAGQADGEEGRSTRDGVYSEEQADVGAAVYTRASCNACHGNDLGGSASGPALKGIAFTFFWEGKDLAGLYTFTRDNMPMGMPNSLAESDYLALVALILRENGLPAGEEALPSDEGELSQITFLSPSAE